MDPRIEKRNKILNYSIIICCIIILILAALYFTIYGTDGLTGNSIYQMGKKYEIGELVDYADTSWYVIKENEKSYSLLKKDALTADEINELNIITSIDGTIPYDVTANCTNDNTGGCHNSLEDSTIGRVLASFQKKHLNNDDLINVDDYMIRLINLDDIDNLKQYDWLYLNNYYWTMSAPNNGNNTIYGLESNKKTYMHMVYDGSSEVSGGLVRPVINIKKMSVE